MALPIFPSTNSIPPACFYNSQGLATWLNQNPSYKLPFSYTGAFPYLFPPEFVPPDLSTLGYKQENVPLCSDVTHLSQGQANQYSQQIKLFQKVYAHNSNAYTNFVNTGTPPVYYNFLTYKEKYEYNSAVQLVNKLYPFRAMANARGVHWQIPFPINM